MGGILVHVSSIQGTSKNKETDSFLKYIMHVQATWTPHGIILRGHLGLLYYFYFHPRAGLILTTPPLINFGKYLLWITKHASNDSMHVRYFTSWQVDHWKEQSSQTSALVWVQCHLICRYSSGAWDKKFVVLPFVLSVDIFPLLLSPFMKLVLRSLAIIELPQMLYYS